MKEIYTKIKITDNSRTDKFKFTDQLRVIMSKVNDRNKLKLEENVKLSRQTLQLESAFINLIDDAILNMREKEKYKVTLLVSSKFLNCFHILESYKLFYKVDVEEDTPDIKGADYFIKVSITNVELMEREKNKENNGG